MRKLAVGAFICVVLAIGTLVYTEWETKKIINSLPQLPAIKQHDTHPHDSQADRSSTFSNIAEVEYETFTQEDLNPLKPSTANVPLIDEQLKTDEDRQVSEDWRTDDKHVHTRQATRNPFGRKITDLDEMDPDELADMLLVGLLQRFGDIPEVHTFIALKRKKFKKQSLTLDEHIDYTAAQLHLWPHPETQKTLEIFLEKKASEYPSSTQIVR